MKAILTVILAIIATGQFGFSAENTNASKMSVAGVKVADCKFWLDENFKKNAIGVAVNGNFAYVADGSFGIQVIDVSNPVHMRHIAHVDIGGYAKEGIKIQGNFLYALRSSWRTSELVVVDVTSPAQPSVVGRVQFPGMAWGLDISGNQAFVGVDNGHVENGGGLAIIDVRIPAQPSLIGWYKCNKALGVYVVGSRAYIATWEDGIAIVDVRDPKNPTLVCQFPCPGAAFSVYVENQLAYVAANQEGLQIFDISNPNQPKRLGSFNPNPSTNHDYGVADVVVKDGLAFVTDVREGLFIVDVSNAANPVMLAKPGAMPCYGVRIQDQRVYVTARQHGLLTFEIGGWIQNESKIPVTARVLPPLQISGGSIITTSVTTTSLGARPNFKMAWESSLGWKYTILTATNDLSSWVPVPDFVDVPGTGGMMAYTVNMLQPKQFFRVAARRNDEQ